MYQWLLYLHIGTVLAFMLAHGVQVTVIWKQRTEKDPARNLALFEALPSSRLLRVAMSAVVISGLALVVLLSLWSRAWIWLSLGLLAAIWLTMWIWGGTYYSLIESAATSAIEAKGSPQEDKTLADFNRARLSWYPIGMAIVGPVGLAAILWLMVFKPF